MAEGRIGLVESESSPEARQSSSFSHYTPSQLAKISDETCRLMDLLGYGELIRQARRYGYRIRDRLMDVSFGHAFYMITSGSKGEGLANMYESDIDLLAVLRDVVCLEDGLNDGTLPRVMTVFILNFGLCYPGHCKLLLCKRGQRIRPILQNALVEDGYGGALLSSDLFYRNCEHDYMDDDMDVEFQRNQRAGPSLPFTCFGLFKMDFVYCLPCLCPSILNRWAARSRHWPPTHVVQKVVSMGAFVTPVAYQGSEYKHVEWRLCFNTGEMELLCNLNDVQIKVYVILKMILKDVLKPKNKEITSYMVKNVVLWLAERSQNSLCNEKSLFNWLREGLIFLRNAIVTMHLPCYIIPERNLLAACGMREDLQHTWITIMKEMIEEGPRILLRLPKMRRAIIAHPEPLFLYYRMKTELELLFLMCTNRFIKYINDDVDDSEGDRFIEEFNICLGLILSPVLPLLNVDWNIDIDKRGSALIDILAGLLM
ncbi:uncharacterized protein LOC127870479 [Dreissena polymorpha]|uniref:Mab-21-like HhH/H2TH-like domain-containing protein n=1 Tax=Dreissena polymorpha TaxID=45954 RepID=A0A9D4MFH9_DREPO|nr:uncharacterized protein LOC127870479 [Dreissena polymorpha]XP_052269025.1 uncharacterized protein LOC127870479 [Dreissena polymorpha]KAH3875868.1 hypothetical protein DPMN_039149 [Dreissena polymorpha]